MWDSALDRRELGEAIASRFDGAVTYYDQPKTSRKASTTRNQFRSTAVLDWATLHPVERLELLTTHDLARQEKQKLELLRNLLTYYHYATSESREEVLRVEINRVRAAADELRERYRAEYNHVPAAVNRNYAPTPVNDNMRLRRSTTISPSTSPHPVINAGTAAISLARHFQTEPTPLPETELGHTALACLAALGGAASDSRWSADRFRCDRMSWPTCRVVDVPRRLELAWLS